MDIKNILQKLKTKYIGRNIYWKQQTFSTNTDALQSEEKEGTIFLAEYQSNGRGRKGRIWYSPEGRNILLSIIITPKNKQLHKYTLMTALVVVKTLERFNIKGFIKWPNDVVVNGRKICGILAESNNRKLVIGIGLNVNFKYTELPDEIKETSTSMCIETGKEIDKIEVLIDLLEEFEKYYETIKKDEFSAIEYEIKKYSILFGRKVKVENKGIIEGVVKGLDSNWFLIVDNNIVNSGDVTIIN